VNPGFNENEAELGVLVATAALKVLAHGNSLLNEEVKVLGEFGGHAVLLEKTKDLGASDTGNLGNAVGITEDHTDLGRGEALLGELAHMIFDVYVFRARQGMARQGISTRIE
jgi:hypothetical protein